MGHRITDLGPEQGLCANLLTSTLVLFASRFGMPVSTTHVACGSIFGIGIAERSLRWNTMAAVMLTWVMTLPLAALLGGGLYRLLAGSVLPG
jgi:PiT family inorganic phosphate transporter